MPFFTLSFLAGVLTLPLFSQIPALWWFLPIIFITAFLWKMSSNPWRIFFKFLCVASLGCIFVLFRSEQLLKWTLPEALETQTITVSGTIVSLPTIKDAGFATANLSKDKDATFEFMLDSINQKPTHALISLSWYQYNGVPLKISDRWQLQVRLKRAHGLLNPGGFDYEKWLFSKGIRATGHIVNPKFAKVISNAYPSNFINHCREELQQKISQALPEEKTAGLILALIVGVQNQITQDQWDTMQKTGTNHLMAVAGVHIAFVSGFAYLLINFLWRRSTPLLLSVAAPQAAAMGALIMALVYSALAGFSLPTQRALIMLSVFTIGIFIRRELHTWNAFLLSILLVILWDPLATLSTSFWLSFGAVSAIIYGVSGRIKPSGVWWKYMRVQWVITLALIPISLALFQQSSFISLIANLIAVPAIGILVLPLCLIGASSLLFFKPLGQILLSLAAKIISMIWWVLAKLGSLKWAIWQQSIPHDWMLIAALIGVLFLIAPHGFPIRWLGFFWLMPIIFTAPDTPKANALRLSLLDVGQGLSAVIQTQHHTLIFDTGPRMGAYDDAGNSIIFPFLTHIGIKKIDTLVISHGDSDHIGGAFSLLKKMPVNQILTSVPERFFKQTAQTCLAGQTWQWDGVTFNMLYPTPDLLHQDNNSSCVLHIKTPQGDSILLTGDIEKPAEDYLVSHQAQALEATLLVAPHHGSKTSSTENFVALVHPQYVLLPTGYKNRFKFPHLSVVTRYHQENAMLFNTATDGAIMIDIDPKNKMTVKTQRLLDNQIWR